MRRVYEFLMKPDWHLHSVDMGIILLSGTIGFIFGELFYSLMLGCIVAIGLNMWCTSYAWEYYK